MKMTKLLALVAASAASFGAWADDIELGIPGYGGTGCPQGSVSATLSPDYKSLSILFDSFTVEAGGATGKTIDRKNCNVRIPVHVPQGYSFSIITVDYRGFNSLPMGARSQFNVEYFFAGSAGPRYSKQFRGPLTDEYLITNRLGLEAIIWSPCGKDVNLATNAAMLVQNSNRREEAVATVDSIDISAGVVYQLQWKRCF